MSEKPEISTQIIETFDENGNVIKFELLDIIDFDNKEYALLYPVNEEQESDEDEAVIMKLIQEGEDYIFEQIDNDEEFEKVERYIQDLQETSD